MLSILILHWNLGYEIVRKSFNLIIWVQLDFQTHFSSKKVPSGFSSRSQSLVRYVCCIIPLKCYFSSNNWNSEWPKLTECCPVILVWTWLENQSHFFSSTSFIFLSTCQSIAVYLKPIVRSLKLWNMSVTSDLESWSTKCGKNSSIVELS